MFIIIPSFIVAPVYSVIRMLASFPGMVLQEIMHKIICWHCNVPTYKRIYVFFKKENQENIPDTIVYAPWQAFYIMFFPYFINSLLCMILTIPLNIDFQAHNLFLSSLGCLGFLSAWIGLSAGFYAIPEEQDLDAIIALTSIEESNFGLDFSMRLIMLFSLPGIGFLFRVLYVALLMFLMRVLLI